jgi:hypothetical protein
MAHIADAADAAVVASAAVASAALGRRWVGEGA